MSLQEHDGQRYTDHRSIVRLKTADAAANLTAIAGLVMLAMLSDNTTSAEVKSNRSNMCGIEVDTIPTDSPDGSGAPDVSTCACSMQLVTCSLIKVSGKN